MNLIGHNGQARHCRQAHNKPISVLKCCGDKVVTGSYDATVLVHRTLDLYLLNSVYIHTGGITAVALAMVRTSNTCMIEEFTPY